MLSKATLDLIVRVFRTETEALSGMLDIPVEDAHDVWTSAHGVEPDALDALSREFAGVAFDLFRKDPANTPDDVVVGLFSLAFKLGMEAESYLNYMAREHFPEVIGTNDEYGPRTEIDGQGLGDEEEEAA